jgi:hypothetical protein
MDNCYINTKGFFFVDKSNNNNSFDWIENPIAEIREHVVALPFYHKILITL